MSASCAGRDSPACALSVLLCFAIAPVADPLLTTTKKQAHPEIGYLCERPDKTGKGFKCDGKQEEEEERMVVALVIPPRRGIRATSDDEKDVTSLLTAMRAQSLTPPVHHNPCLCQPSHPPIIIKDSISSETRRGPSVGK